MERTQPGKVSARERAEQYIRDSLFWGRLRVGERIDQDVVAARLGISRIPVREALLGLARDGLLQSDFSRGCYVANLDATWLREHFEAYGTLAGIAGAGLIARGVTPHLEALAEHFAVVTDADDPAEAYRATWAFRWTVYRNGAGTRMRGILRGLEKSLMTDFYALPGARESAAVHLRDELAGYWSNDAHAVRAAMLALARRCGELLIGVLDENGMFQPATGTFSGGMSD